MITGVAEPVRLLPGFRREKSHGGPSAREGEGAQFGLGLSFHEQRDERANPAVVEALLNAGDGVRDDIPRDFGVPVRDPLGGQVDEVLFLLRFHSLIFDYGTAPVKGRGMSSYNASITRRV